MSFFDRFAKQILFVASLLLFLFLIAKIDRLYLKRNDGFCIHHILANLPFHPEWEVSEPSPASLEELLNQPFTYVGKGHQSYVFLDQKGEYVLKFYRFPSHLRLLPWLHHPLSYRFNARRIKIKEYNLQKLHTSFRSYKIAHEDLFDETGVLWVHLNRTSHLNKRVQLIDKTGSRYSVDLDSTVFLIQKRAHLIFPTLKTWIEKKEEKRAEQLLLALFSLIERRCKKGIADNDAVLEKNYGWLEDDAIHIDVGRFCKMREALPYKEEIQRVTWPLHDWLKEHSPSLLDFYQRQLDAYSS